jgi:hypothetical protein
MIPKYTGYLPRKFIQKKSIFIDKYFFFVERKFRAGQTFGDTTRNLPVCSHSFSNYGDFVRSNTFI